MVKVDSLARWQRITVATLFVGYVGYYVCRSNLSVAAPLLQASLGERGLTKDDLGMVASVGVAMYALGKIVNGLLADSFGGRALFLLGMAASVVCTIAFGMSSSLLVFAVLWGANRYFQSMGWVALVKTASRWFPVHRHATVMGILSMSFLMGDALGRLYLGTVISLGERTGGSVGAVLTNWRAIFFIAAATLGVITVVAFIFLKSSPEAIGAEEPEANPVNVFGAAGNSAARTPVFELLRPLLCSSLFWLICGMNFGLTLVRETFNFWTPMFMKERVGVSDGSAALYSLFFPLVGGVSAYLAGRLSDRFSGRHGRVVVPSAILLVVALLALAAADVSGRPNFALALLGTVAFFLIAPYSYFSGVMAIDLGGKRGSSTAAGLIDSAGYVGAILSGAGVGAVAQRFGWGSAFACLAACAALTALLAVAYWWRHERLLQHWAAMVPPDGTDRADREFRPTSLPVP